MAGTTLWNSFRGAVVDTGSKLGNVAGAAAYKAKLQTDLLFIDRELQSRKEAFGIELYDYVEPLSRDQSFYTSDDTLTVTLQPPLITAQREISVLVLKTKQQQALVEKAAAVRATAFRPATTWTDTLANTAKSAALGGNEAKLSTTLAALQTQIQHHKRQFGLTLYKTLEELEDVKQWLPTDREIRSIYDMCRRDVDKILKKRAAKQKEIEAVDNGGVEAYNSPQQPNGSETPTFTIQTKGAQPSMYATTVGNSNNNSNINSEQQYGSTNGGAAPIPGTVNSPQPASTMYPTNHSGGAYHHQQREPQTSAARPQQSLRQEHQVPPSYGTQQPAMQQQQQQQQPVLHNNLFAGVVPGSTPIIPQQQQQSAPSAADPFDVFDTGAMNHALPQQQPSSSSYAPAADPFAVAPVPQQQQPTLQADPFAAGNHFQPTPTTTTTQAPVDAYDDPFAGL